MDDFYFDPLDSNPFIFGRPRERIGVLEGLETSPLIWANVNGWVIPVAGTDAVRPDPQIANVVKMYPPPESDTRIDFVFLEAWMARVDANPSTVNKPEASRLWLYGNVKYGGINPMDDLEDPAMGFSTTGRVQIQYRIRVFGQGEALGTSTALVTHPDGLGDPNILGQGASSAPVGGFAFVNMREELGDPSLWRSGDGDPTNGLGTLDGYTYAIPICAVFRRHTQGYLAVNQGAGHPNQNGAKERTPHTRYLANPLTGARTLSQAALGVVLDYGAALPITIAVTDLDGCGLEDAEHVTASTFVYIDEELVNIECPVDLVGSTITIPAGGRGRFGTAITRHEIGAPIRLFNTRPDGLYADQIAGSDVLDLRRGINANDWDYSRLLQHNVAALVRGDFKTSWKRSVDGDTQGTTVHEVDYMLTHSGGPVPAGVQQIDGADGIRTVFSDAACIQRDVTLLLDNDAQKVNQYASSLDASVAWDVGPDFHPAAFFNTAGFDVGGDVWTNGSTVFLYLGGNDGISGARATFKDVTVQGVRAVMPTEYWKTNYPVVDPNNGNQYPVSMRFLDRRCMEPAPPDLSGTPDPNFPIFEDRHVGPWYPWRDYLFIAPFCILGGIVRSDMRLVGQSVANFSGLLELEVGLDFDTAGIFYSKDSYGNFQDDPTAVSKPLINGRTTLWNLLTDGGKDLSGLSSNLYIVTYGDTTVGGRGNNGLFRVIGAGQTAGYTLFPAGASTRVQIFQVCQIPAPSPGTGQTITVEFRSNIHNSDDTSSQMAGFADLAVVLTDIGGVLSAHPWYRDNLGYLAGDSYDLSTPLDSGGTNEPYIESKMLLNLTLMYHPGHGGTARVADSVLRFAKKFNIVGGDGPYLRQAPATLDAGFAANAGMPTDEIYWDPTHIQTWNRLPALGWDAPNAPNQTGVYGGNVVGYTEQDREHELFFDRGSKTFVFRPFRSREMTVQAQTVPDAAYATGYCLLGPENYPDGEAKDSLSIWTAKKTQAFVVPREFMPRFGRQDIPFWVDIDAGAGPYLQGINHLFVDNTAPTNAIFNIIGGEDITVGPLVKSFYFATGVGNPSIAATYGHHDTFPAPILNKPFIGARRTTDISTATSEGAALVARLAAVNSSDFGKGLKGIQLPPYYGPARIYGVYTAEDFQVAGGNTFDVDRVTPMANPPPNLLKEDACQQTLFIFQDGAQDYTGSVDDHTYIIPSNALDITRANNYTPGDLFEDHHYVVECVVFGFARGFINANNYVLTRLHDGSGVVNTDGDDPELEGIRMVIPCPAGLNDNLYSAYNRTPYQGDPFMTRGGDAQATTDYQERYGQVPINAQYLVRTPIQQFDSSGNFVPTIPNARAFEILASMDFYTTLGTGKVGGQLYPGTCLDVGYTEEGLASSVRMPASSTSPDWRIITRAFTEGQQDNPTKARLTLIFSSLTHLNPEAKQHHVLRFGLLDGTYIDMYASIGAHITDITDFPPAGLGLPADQVWIVDATLELCAQNLATKINAHPDLNRSMQALAQGTTVELYAIPYGPDGNQLTVESKFWTNDPSLLTYAGCLTPKTSTGYAVSILNMPYPILFSHFVDAEYYPANAGNGTSQVNLTGMTERLPLGVLLQDSDFICENPLDDQASAMNSSPVGPRPIQTIMPLTAGGEEFTRFMGEPGSLISTSDGSVCVLNYTAWTTSTPLGTRAFRTYRGGGPAFILSGDNPGGPIDWVGESFPSSITPVLKGGALACRALLVRNFYEEVNVLGSIYPVSHGDEIQMVITTCGLLGDGYTREDGITFDGIISPSGYGEGMASSDRYRIEGRPMFRGHGQWTPDPNTVQLAVYPDEQRQPPER